MINSSLESAQLAHRSYTDLNSLQTIKQQDREGAIKEVASQFESIYMQMMLKSMRDANSAFSEGNFLNTSEMKFHQDMLDKQLSLTLSEGKGLGLAEVIVKQLSRQAGVSSSVNNNASSESQNPNQLQSYRARPVALSPLAASYGAKVSTAADKPVNKDPDISNPQQFVEAVWPLAQRVGKMLGVNPKVILAQSALETGWGQSINSDGDKNFFGIKATAQWQGDSVNRQTLEHRDGVLKPERAQFRNYDSYAESFNDYADFLKSNPRYQGALQAGEDSQQFAQELQAAGYATDPHYAKKIAGIVEGKQLRSAFEMMPELALKGEG